MQIEMGHGDTLFGWGNHVTLWSCKWWEGRVYGHMTPIPSVGARVQQEMESGRVITGTLVEVEPCGDPADMFFGRVEWDLHWMPPEVLPWHKRILRWWQVRREGG